MSSNYPDVYVVLDALDECDNDALEEVLRCVSQTKGSNIKIICTSRPHIANLSARLGDHVFLLISAYVNDLENYVARRLEKEWRYSDHMKNKILIKLPHEADGKYIPLAGPLLTTDFFL